MGQLMWAHKATVAFAVLCAGCTDVLPQFDNLLNDRGSNATTPPPSAARPQADSRGVIAFGTTQAVVAKEGDTIASLAASLGQDPDRFANRNGLTRGEPLRDGQILVLSDPVSEAPETAATGEDISEISVAALDRALEAENGASSAAAASGAAAAISAPADAPDPVQHRVARGETAYSISRLYNVSVRALADWNGLDTNYTVREGQTLLIPLPSANGSAPTETAAVSSPGEGTPAPTPPSAREPLPNETINVPSAAAAAPVAATALDAPQTASSDTARFVKPVPGPVIREYVAGQNEGVSFETPSGTPVKAADAGTVAAITRDVEQVPIVVIRHPGNVLTVYANVDDIRVAQGATVARGQEFALVRDGDPSFLHFEVREGFDSVDPLDYLQ